jgi:hypothetical protein
MYIMPLVGGIMQLITHGVNDVFLTGNLNLLPRESATTLVIKHGSTKLRSILKCPVSATTTLTVELFDGSRGESLYNIKVSTENSETQIQFKTRSRGGFIGELTEFCKSGTLTYSVIEMFISALGFVPLHRLGCYVGEQFASMEDFYARRKPVTMINFLGVQIPEVIYKHMTTAVALAADTGEMLTLDHIPEHLKSYVKDALRALNKSNRYSFTIENMAVYDFLGLLDSLVQWGPSCIISGDKIVELTPQAALRAGYVVKDVRSIPYSFKNAHKHIRDKTLINDNIIKLLEPYKRLKERTKNMKLGEIDIIAFTCLVKTG